jgi:hypothetical protein
MPRPEILGTLIGRRISPARVIIMLSIIPYHDPSPSCASELGLTCDLAGVPERTFDD